jgi:TATA-box binding protein (TBP) (component of TFIID and TFIIIB)
MDLNMNHVNEIQPYKISTITATGSIGSGIDCNNLFDNLQIEEDQDKEGFAYIESGVKNGEYWSKGFHKKNKKKEKPKKRFDNQTTLVCRLFDDTLNRFSNVNCKLFKNGNIHMTGLKYVDQGNKVLKFIIKTLPQDLLEQSKETLEPINYNVRLINCDFRTGYEIRRDKLCKLIQSTSEIFCNYEPCIYPGVKIQYNYNTDNEHNGDGVCKCKNQCVGKGSGSGDGNCKRVTICVFQSGCIIITGGQSHEQVMAAHTYINRVLKENILSVGKNISENNNI